MSTEVVDVIQAELVVEDGAPLFQPNRFEPGLHAVVQRRAESSRCAKPGNPRHLDGIEGWGSSS